MSRSAVNIAILISGLAAGWASALYSIESVGSTTAGTNGQWRSWDTGTRNDASPYAIAHYLLEGEIPPAEGLFRSYYTGRDDAGQALDPRCVYRVTAPKDSVRWWSFSAGRQPESDATLPVTVTSDSVLRDKDGKVTIAVSASPQPGNWVAPPPGNRIEFGFLVAHDGKLGDEDKGVLPAVVKEGC